MSTDAPEHLAPSALGTRSYWDDIYTREVANHESNPTDEGTVWFSDAGAEEKMLEYLERLSDEGFLDKDLEHENGGPSFLDLGTGNGHLLIALREDGWKGRLLGVDYSEQSVRLARNVWDERMRAIRDQWKSGEDGSWQNMELAGEESQHLIINDISFTRWDLLKEPAGDWLVDGFEVVLDKGTFDAISLSEEKDEQDRRIFENYRACVERLVKPGGILLITSCNWTENELRSWLEGGDMLYEDKVRYPTFTFGGKTGSQVVTLCFKKKETAAPVGSTNR